MLPAFPWTRVAQPIRPCTSSPVPGSFTDTAAAANSPVNSTPPPVDDELPLPDAPVLAEPPPTPLEVEGPLAVVADEVVSPPAPVELGLPLALVAIDELPVVVIDESPVVADEVLPPVPPCGSGPGHPMSAKGVMKVSASAVRCIGRFVMSSPA